MIKLDKDSVNLERKNIEKIKKIFPQVAIEKEIDFEKLKLLLGKEINDSFEKYQFTWNGKSKAIKLAQMPSTATLRPSKEDSKDWDTTENLYIEGDNLEVLKQLQKTYFGKIKMIYIDPPYNTGGDFVYKDDFKDSIKHYKEQTNQNKSSNAETSGRYHTDWLNMMYPRLMLAKNLLANDGVIFVSIDENEITNLKKIMQEIFGETNELNSIVWLKRNAQNDATNIQKNHEYIVVFKIDEPNLSSKNYVRREVLKDDLGWYYIGAGITTGGEGGTLKRRPNLGYTIYFNPKNYNMVAYDDYDHDLCKKSDIESEVYTDNTKLIDKGYVKIRPPKKGKSLGCWTWSINKFNEEKHKINIAESNKGYSVRKKEYVNEEIVKEDKNSNYINEENSFPLKSFLEISSGLGSKAVNSLLGHKIFENSKPISLVEDLLRSVSSENQIILDFFSGSSTTAHAVMKLNAEDGGSRKFIMVQLPEQTDKKSEAYKAGYKNICEIGKERIRRAGEQIKQELIEKKEKAEMLDENIADPDSLDIGFKVFKLDDTNIKAWDSSTEVTNETLLDQVEVIKENRSKEDVLYEVLLKYGVFNQPVKELKINKKTMYDIGEGYMIVNLNDKIEDSDIKEITKQNPYVVIFLESGFINDNDKINAEATLKHNGVEDVKCI
jgi:adenine-specific DNA-methyltransferase